MERKKSGECLVKYEFQKNNNNPIVISFCVMILNLFLRDIFVVIVFRHDVTCDCEVFLT